MPSPALLRAMARRSLYTRMNPAMLSMIRRRGVPMGDPFLGALIGKAAGFVLPKIGGLIRKVLPTRGSIAGIASPVSLPGAGILPAGRLGRVLRGVGGAAALGGGFEVGSRIVGGALGEAEQALTGGGFRRKRRTMRVTNVTALRRACRRVSGFRDLALKTVSLSAAVRPRRKKGKRCR